MEYTKELIEAALAKKIEFLKVLEPLGFKDSQDPANLFDIYHPACGVTIDTYVRTLEGVILEFYQHGVAKGRNKMQVEIQKALGMV